jgi:hypothetical protein
MSKNAPTIQQLNIACRHVVELIEARMSENLAKSLEIYANVYVKYRVHGEAKPDHADQYDHWSKAARKLEARYIRKVPEGDIKVVNPPVPLSRLLIATKAICFALEGVVEPMRRLRRPHDLSRFSDRKFRP